MPNTYWTYFVLSKNIKSISVDEAPRTYTAVEGDLATGAIPKQLDERSFDLVIGPGDSGCDVATLRSLRALLVPGGFLLSPSSSPSFWTSTLDAAGFDAVVIHDEYDFNKLDGNVTVEGANHDTVTIYAQAPSIPEALPQADLARYQFIVLYYELGQEMAIQAALKQLDDPFNQPIWLVATEGTNADSLQGFGRSLTKEFLQWNIRMASFADCFDETERHRIIDQYLPQTGVEREFVVDADLRVTVPRVVPSSSPTTAGTLTRTSSFALEKDEVLLDVSHSSW